MRDPRLIKLLQRFPTKTVCQRVSPANAHYEILAFLDCFNAERFCGQQDLAQLLTLLGLERLDVDFVRALDLDRTTLRTGVLELHRVIVPACSGAAAVPQRFSSTTA
jgi:hypothetical protein